MKSGLLRARLQPCRKWLDRDAALAAEGPLADLQTFPEIRAKQPDSQQQEKCSKAVLLQMQSCRFGQTRIPFGNDKQKKSLSG